MDAKVAAVDADLPNSDAPVFWRRKLQFVLASWRLRRSASQAQMRSSTPLDEVDRGFLERKAHQGIGRANLAGGEGLEVDGTHRPLHKDVALKCGVDGAFRQLLDERMVRWQVEVVGNRYVLGTDLKADHDRGFIFAIGLTVISPSSSSQA